MRQRQTIRRTIVTTNPDPPALPAKCPGCDETLIYRETVIGGVKPIERYDYYECRTCGRFQYRQRTRALRAVTA